jgi:hypothetical protein
MVENRYPRCPFQEIICLIWTILSRRNFSKDDFDSINSDIHPPKEAAK